MPRIFNSIYRFQRELGKGGFGTVFLAREDVSHLSDHLHRNPSDLEAHNLLLQCFYETDRHDVAMSLARSILEIEPNNPCFANNYYIASLLQKMGQKIPPTELLGEYTNDFIAYNFSVVNESALTHGWQSAPPLKSKLLFMDYPFCKLARSPIFIPNDPTDLKKAPQVGKLIITFGREGYEVNDVQVAGATNVSRRHCVVVNCRDDVWLYDLDSTRTHVNGERVKGKMPLIGRNVVRVGNKEFVITNDEDSLI